LTKRNVIKRYTFIQKYATTYLFPNSFYFNLPGIFLDYNKDSIDFSNINGNILGLIHENGKMKKFLLLNTNLNELKKFKNDLIREIVFFENLDIYNLKKGYFKYRNYVTDIYNLYSDYKDDNFRDLSVNFKLKLYYKETNMNQHNFDLNSLIHIINTSKIPLDIEIHPEIKKSISYRNKLVTFYGSINYFIHIYDTKNKPLDRYWELFDILLKNTFSNGFIIHYKTGLLLSTNAFQEDFEKVRNSFMEFVWSFKLECRIYENLNYIPFSFYHLPNSTYYSNETNNWDFPVFEDKSIPEYFDHLAVNYKQEVKRLEDEKFKKRVEETLERLTKEIEEIKMTKNKTNN
jgi:hypothetical protein